MPVARDLLRDKGFLSLPETLGPDTLAGSGPLPPPTESDLVLEHRIHQVTWALAHASGEHNRRDYAALQRELIKLRSPAQIARMERAKGLR